MLGTAVCTLLLLLSVEAAGLQEDPGRRAYTGAGCSGCHGPRARGGVDGPALVPAKGTEAEFAQSFQEAMPGFEATDEELSMIYSYLKNLTDPSGDAGGVGSGSAELASEGEEPAGIASEGSWEPGSAADAQALQEGAGHYEAAWDAKDAKALSELFTEDAERILVNGERVIGRAAIEKQFAESFVKPPASDTVTITPASIHFLSADLAVIHGTWLMTSDGGQSGSGKYMNVYVKRGGRWLVVRSMLMQPTEP